MVIEAYLDGALPPAATPCEAALAASATVAADDGLPARLQPHEAAVLALSRARAARALRRARAPFRRPIPPF